MDKLRVKQFVKDLRSISTDLSEVEAMRESNEILIAYLRETEAKELATAWEECEEAFCGNWAHK